MNRATVPLPLRIWPNSHWEFPENGRRETQRRKRCQHAPLFFRPVWGTPESRCPPGGVPIRPAQNHHGGRRGRAGAARPDWWTWAPTRRVECVSALPPNAGRVTCSACPTRNKVHSLGAHAVFYRQRVVKIPVPATFDKQFGNSLSIVLRPYAAGLSTVRRPCAFGGVKTLLFC